MKTLHYFNKNTKNEKRLLFLYTKDDKRGPLVFHKGLTSDVDKPAQMSVEAKLVGADVGDCQI